MPPAALVAGAAVGGITGAIGAGQQADAAREAAKLQASAAERDAALREKMFTDISQRGQQLYEGAEERFNPYLQTGQQATEQLRQMMTMGQLMPQFDTSPEQFYQQVSQPFQYDPEEDPGTQFRMQQGLDALEKSAAARGGFFSGQTGKELQQFGQGLASDEYQKAYARDLAQKQMMADQYYRALGTEQQGAMNLYNMLSGLSGSGQQAAGTVGGLGMQSLGAQQAAAQQMQNMYSPAAMAQAQGILGAGQAQAGATQAIGQNLMGAIGQAAQYDLMRQSGLLGGA